MSADDRQDTLIHELGSMILADEDYKDQDWDSLSLVLKFKGESEGAHGYKYAGDRWRASTFDSSDIFDKIVELKTAMAQQTGEPWNYALLTIVAPEMKIAIDFSYAKKNPWDVETKSLDMHDYAMSLRSPDHPKTSRVSGELPRGWNTPRS